MFNFNFWKKKPIPVFHDVYKPEKTEDDPFHLLHILQQIPNTHTVFIPGELSEYYGKPVLQAFTVQKMSLWFRERMGIAVCMTKLQVPRGRVKGNIYVLPEQKFKILDFFSSNSVVWKKIYAPLILPRVDHNGEPLTVRALMYQGLNSYWGPKIEWDQTFYNRNPEFIMADVIKDNRPWLNVYYDNRVKEPEEKPRRDRCFLALINGNNKEQQHNRAA